MERARSLAQQLLENSPTSILYTKRLLCEFSKSAVTSEIELALEENAQIRSTPDFREGLSAFLEKRKPAWERN
jgi:methylglutaconyl-CoA hydratase